MCYVCVLPHLIQCCVTKIFDKMFIQTKIIWQWRNYSSFSLSHQLKYKNVLAIDFNENSKTGYLQWIYALKCDKKNCFTNFFSLSFSIEYKKFIWTFFSSLDCPFFQTWFFTDTDNDEFYNKRLNKHLINTKCPKGHSRRALCCKMAVELITFLEHRKK